jgi:alcohol dehydrogenase
MVNAGFAEQVKSYILDEGLEVFIFSGVCPNPTDVNVRDALMVWQENKCDLLVTLGGGSSHDCGKAMGIMATSGGDIRDYAGVNTLKSSLPPYISINTTAGTASEITRFAVVTNTDTDVKMIFGDGRLTADVAINDPVFHMGMPRSLTAATGMDALTHAIEAYVSKQATPVTDVCALGAIELVAKWLRPTVADGTNLEARSQMVYAEYLAGMAFNNAVLGIVHSMAHQAGSLRDLPHGVCNAIILPVVCEYNLLAAPEKFAKIAESMGENIDGLSILDAADKAIGAIRRLAKDIGIPAGLGELGILEEDVPQMADNALKDVCTLFNPRSVTYDDIVRLYKSII